MAVEGFDYKSFAQDLSQQAFGLLPPDFDDNQKNYVANTLLNFATLAGEALATDKQLKFDMDQSILITQIIAEWSFHKSVDLIRSGIPRQYWDSIMQKIGYTMFEIAKTAFGNGIPQDQALQLIEHHVKKTYIDCIVELKDKNLIDDGLMEFAANQSNIDSMVQQQTQEQSIDENGQPIDAQQPQTADMPVNPSNEQNNQTTSPENTKVLKLATLAMLFRNLQQEKVQVILNKINPDDANSVIKFMGLPDLDERIDAGFAIQCLQEIKMKLPSHDKEVSPSKILKRIQNVSQYIDRGQLEQKLRLERSKVKRFVFTALEGEYYEMPPKIANIIATHIENSV